ncbi:MAG: WecB/TagA/CpsF family glycosyltransferase [Acetobacteraceae bacterium]
MSTASPTEIVGRALYQTRTPQEGVALVVTPNIEHVARLRQSRPLAKAYQNASVVVCDGWPVHLYARVCGLPVGRVTGCELAAVLMRREDFPPDSRFFFVVDQPDTAAELTRWAERKGLCGRVASFVPPFGFEHDEALCTELAGRVRTHGTTVLIMAVGAPRSEIFVDRFRSALPPCWAFCVGQAVKVELGMVRRAPPVWQRLGMEWLWRVGQEPRRLARRYATASVGFVLAVLEDQFRRRPSSSSQRSVRPSGAS